MEAERWTRTLEADVGFGLGPLSGRTVYPSSLPFTLHMASKGRDMVEDHSLGHHVPWPVPQELRSSL